MKQGYNSNPYPFPQNDAKRVGASVSVEANVPIGQYPYPPGAYPPGPYPPIGCPPGPYPYPPIGYPPCYPPPFYPPRIIDDRIPPVNPIIRDVAISVSILPGQSIDTGFTQPLLLGTINFSRGGATISGNGILLPVPGLYNVSLTATVTRLGTSSTGEVAFTISGPISSGVSEIIGTVLSGTTQTISGTTSVNVLNRDAIILFNTFNSGGGPVIIDSGSITVSKI